MGTIVFFVNLEFGWQAATPAAVKQAAYTFLFGGIVIKLCETLALKPQNKWKGIFLGAIVASIITISAVFLVHNLKGTPKPFESTLPVIILGPPGFIFLAARSRKEKI